MWIPIFLFLLDLEAVGGQMKKSMKINTELYRGGRGINKKDQFLL